MKVEIFTDGLAIRTVWKLIDHTWNQRDAERFCRLFTEDASLEFVATGPSLKGRAAIRRHFAEQFPRYPSQVRHSTHVRSIHDAGSGVVAVDADAEILGHGSAGEATGVLRKFIVSAVMLRTFEGWELRWMRVFPQTVSSDTQV